MRIALALLLVGCAAAEDLPTPDDNDPPLSGYDPLFEGTPENSTLPDDNKADAVYPPVHDALVGEQSPVRSQGSRGVCSIFSTVAQMEHLYIKAGMQDPDFSEQFLQWSTKVESGEFTWTGGSNTGVNLSTIAEHGIVAESDWPYQSAPWTAANDPECGKPEAEQPVRCFTNGDPPASALQATRYKLPRGRWLNTNSIKAHITTKNTGVGVGLDFFYQSWNHRRSTLPINSEYWRQGYVLYPNADDVTESHKQRAGHAIYIIGWDDNLEVPIVDKDGHTVNGPDGQPIKEKGFYLFKNSWGTAGFGIENPHGAGFGYISMRYVHEEGSAYVTDPPATDPPPPPPPPAGGDTFTNTTGADIPDNSPAGVTSTIDATTQGPIAGLTVSLDITHPYVGDLTVKLRHGGREETLHAETGGSDNDLRKSYPLTQWNGAERGGAWELVVVDGAAQDVGRLNSWTIEVR